MSNTHDTSGDGKCWRVMRQDDHGNQFVVCDGLTESEAQSVASDFTARGHKQMYWAQRMPSADTKSKD